MMDHLGEDDEYAGNSYLLGLQMQMEDGAS